MRHVFLASAILALSSCTSFPPVVLSGSYTLPGGKGVVSFHIPFEPALPSTPGSDEASLFPTPQK